MTQREGEPLRYSGERICPVYDRDGITVYQGDCRDVLPLLDAVDHVITDPPYAQDVYVRMGRVPEPGDYRILKDGAIARMAAGDIGSIDAILADVACETGRLARRWAVVFSDAETTWRWRGQLEQAGMRYVRTGAWVKPDAMPQMSGDRPSVGFEPCTITHAQGAMRWNGGGRAAVWTHNTTKGNDRPDHPCPKPISLMRELIELFTDPGDLVLDPFGGSLTTAVACKQLGRRCITVELDAGYVQAGIKRLEATTLPLFVLPPEKPVQEGLAL